MVSLLTAFFVMTALQTYFERFLLPPYYKTIGWLIFALGAIVWLQHAALTWTIFEKLHLNVSFVKAPLGLMQFVYRLFGPGGLVIAALAREKQEDEMVAITRIRTMLQCLGLIILQIPLFALWDLVYAIKVQTGASFFDLYSGITMILLLYHFLFPVILQSQTFDV